MAVVLVSCAAATGALARSAGAQGRTGPVRSGPVLSVEATLSGVFDDNIVRAPTPLAAYGGGGELLLRLATAPSRPLLQLEYTGGLRGSSRDDPNSGGAHRVGAQLAPPLARWARLYVIGRGGRGGVDEDLSSVDELMLLGRLDLGTGTQRVRGYAARRWRDEPTARVPAVGSYAGMELRAGLSATTTLLADARYELFEPSDSTRAWQRQSLALTLAQRITRRSAFEIEVRRRAREYPYRQVRLDEGSVLRRDEDWRADAAFVYDNGAGTQLRVEYQHEDRTSTDARRGYGARRVALLVRQRVLSIGAARPAPPIDERPASQLVERAARATGASADAWRFIGVAVGGTHVCATNGAGGTYCWQSGPAVDAGAEAELVPGSWIRVAAGPPRACALDATGATWCWGWRSAEDRAAGASTQPLPVRTELRFVQIAVGSTHSCALTAAGAAYCWGENGDGQLGTGTSRPAATPEPVAGSLTFTEISTGARHSCGLDAAGTVHCWGGNDKGQAAAGAAPRMLLPRAVPDLQAVALSAGSSHTCALTAAGEAFCWGDNGRGQLGSAGAAYASRPLRVAHAAPFTMIGAGWAHTCALDAAQKAYCWGQNRYGQLGIGGADEESHPVPAPVSGERRFVALSVSFRTCGVDARQQVFCWGGGLDPRLGPPQTIPALLAPQPRR